MSGMRGQFSQFGGMGSGTHYPDPFLDVASLSIPTNWRSALYWCLPPGTLVEAADFSHKPVERVVVGDSVMTKSGVPGVVRKTSVRRHSGELVSLQFGGYGNAFRHEMTPDHKVWLYSRERKQFTRVKASSITVGNTVATPRLKITSESTPRFSGWLLGMYVAEGCYIKDGTRRLGVRFTLGQDDEPSGVLDKLLCELTSQTGERASPYTPPSRPDVRLVTVHDVELPDWCHQHGGEFSKEKQLSGRVLAYGHDFVLDLLSGWIDGDGWATAGGLFLTTASKALAVQCLRLANACGLTPSLQEVSNDKGFGSDDSIAWQVQFGRVDSDKLRGRCLKTSDVPVATNPARPRYDLDDDYVYRTVRSVSRRKYDGQVYNFEVTGDHSYIADGVTTSNCEYVFSMFGTYRTAMERVVSYFLTDVDILDASDDETDKWRTFLDKTLDVKTVTQNMLRNRECYGNSFASVVRPFVRFLTCPKCGYLSPLREVHGNKHFNFKYVPGDPDKAFCARCPVCKVGSGYVGPWKIKDEDDDNEKKLKVRIWNPHEIEILHDTYTDETAYLWRIPEDYKKQLRTASDSRGNLFMLERAPREVLKAIANNQIYRFHPDAVFHMKEPTLAGIYNRGWGLPRIISNFRQIWYVQVLRRFNEAIALDYVIPFRIITPAPAQGKSGGGLSIDPMQMYNGSDFRGQVQQMIRRRRKDPASLQVLPFPVNFQMFGADANQLAPRDLMDQAMETLLNDAGTPVELYNGSLQLQTAPVALRLFESTWHHLVHDANAFLTWLVRQVSQIMTWETVTAELKRVTIADNLEKQMMAAQLMMSQQLSGGTVLGDLGYNWKKEQRNIADESRYQSELQTRVQEEMEQAGFAQQIAKGQGGAQGGGDPSQGGGQAPAGGGQPGMAPGMGGQGPVTAYLSQMSPNVPQTPQDMMTVADSLATELMGLPDSVKNSELRKLKQYNQALHSMVIAQIEAKRNETKSQAGNAAMGQMQQQAAGGAPPPA